MYGGIPQSSRGCFLVRAGGLARIDKRSIQLRVSAGLAPASLRSDRPNLVRAGLRGRIVGRLAPEPHAIE